MKNDRKERQVQILLEDAWVFLWVPALLLLVLTVWIWNVSFRPHELVAKLEVQQPGIAQLFVDSGKGFSEAESVKQQIEVANLTTSFRVDLSQFEQVRQFRFDPINNDGLVLLKEFKYKRSGEWLSRSLLEPEYEVANGIRWQWNAKNAWLEIYPSAGNMDPHFIVDGSFEPMSDGALLRKRIFLHLGALLAGCLLGFVLRRQVLSLFVRVWFIAVLPWKGLKILSQKYTGWVDEFSIRWGLVNPTSCVVAGIIVSAISWLSVKDGPLMVDAEKRAEALLKMETSGDVSDRSYTYISYEGKKHPTLYSNIDLRNESLTGKWFEVIFRLSDPKGNIVGIRLDPLEKAGVVTLKHLRLEYPDGYVLPISLTGWTAKGNASIEAESAESVTVRSDGIDPYIASSKPGLEHRLPNSLPPRVMFPIVVFFFVTVGLLLYNRLQTEDLSIEQLRNLQRM